MFIRLKKQNINNVKELYDSKYKLYYYKTNETRIFAVDKIVEKCLKIRSLIISYYYYYN
jgi:hypothetical protein